MTENHIDLIASEAKQSSMQDDDEISLLDLLQVVADNLRLLILAPLAAGLLALGYSYSITPTFTATTKFLLPQQQQSSAAAMLQSLGAMGGLVGVKNPADQYLAFMKSRSVQDALIDRFKLMERYEAKFRQNARNALVGSVRVSSGKNGLITVEVDNKDPAFAAQLANAHVEELQNLLSRLAVTEAQQRRLFFEKQLLIAKDKMVKAEQILKTSGVNASVLKIDPNVTVGGLAQLKAGIVAQEIKLASMRGYLTESAPDFKQAQTELAALRAQVTRTEKEEPAVAGGEGDYIAKYREFKYHETLFDLFTKQFEIARIDESREGTVIQVLDPAQPPELKSKPKKAQIATLTTLATGFALLLFVFIRHAWHGAATTPETSEKIARLRDSTRRALGRS